MAASTHSQRVWETVLLAENSPADNSLITTRYKEMLQGSMLLLLYIFLSFLAKIWILSTPVRFAAAIIDEEVPL